MLDMTPVSYKTIRLVSYARYDDKVSERERDLYRKTTVKSADEDENKEEEDEQNTKKHQKKEQKCHYITVLTGAMLGADNDVFFWNVDHHIGTALGIRLFFLRSIFLITLHRQRAARENVRKEKRKPFVVFLDIELKALTRKFLLHFSRGFHASISGRFFDHEAEYSKDNVGHGPSWIPMRRMKVRHGEAQPFVDLKSSVWSHHVNARGFEGIFGGENKFPVINPAFKRRRRGPSDHVTPIQKIVGQRRS